MRIIFVKGDGTVQYVEEHAPFPEVVSTEKLAQRDRALYDDSQLVVSVSDIGHTQVLKNVWGDSGHVEAPKRR